MFNSITMYALMCMHTFKKIKKHNILFSLCSSPLILFHYYYYHYYVFINNWIFFLHKIFLIFFFLQLTNVLICPTPSLMLLWQLMHFPAHCHGPSSRKQIQLNVIIELDVMAIVPVVSLAIVPML